MGRKIDLPFPFFLSKLEERRLQPPTVPNANANADADARASGLATEGAGAVRCSGGHPPVRSGSYSWPSEGGGTGASPWQPPLDEVDAKAFALAKTPHPRRVKAIRPSAASLSDFIIHLNFTTILLFFKKNS